MLAVLAVVIGCTTLLLVQGSVVYYHHPSVPDWLHSRPSLQTTLSTLFSTGFMLAVVLGAQFLAHSESYALSLGEIAVILVSVGVAAWLWRKIRRIGRELDAARGKTAAVVSDVETQGASRLSRRSAGRAARNKAA